MFYFVKNKFNMFYFVKNKFNKVKLIYTNGLFS